VGIRKRTEQCGLKIALIMGTLFFERGIFSPNQESLVKTYRKKEQHEFGEKEHD
jgi:hypothetical protein